MKTIYILLLLIIFSCKDNSNSNNDSSSSEVQPLTDSISDTVVSEEINIKTVEDIQKSYTLASTLLKEMDSTGFAYNCNNEKSGKVIYFSNNDEVEVIKHMYSEYSHFSATEMYFLKNGTPYFIHKKETSWAFDGMKNGESQTKDDITEKRYYLVDDKLIQCLEKSYTIRSAASDNPLAEEVANKNVDCPTIENIHSEFQTLFKHRSEATDIKCL